MYIVGRPTVDIGGGVASIGLPGYDALGDPHLHEYFTRRFSNIPRLSAVSVFTQFGITSVRRLADVSNFWFKYTWSTHEYITFRDYLQVYLALLWSHCYVVDKSS